MNKKGPVIAILFIAIIGIVGLAAFLATKYFGKGTNGTTGGVVEINYKGLWDNPEIYEPLIKEYEESHPNIKINYTRTSFINLDSFTYKGSHQADVEERLKEGTVDIIRIHQTWIPKYIRYIAPAPKDVITGAEAKKIYYPAIAEGIITKDQVLASPQTIDGLVLFYNKELFAKSGIIDPVAATKDWDVTLVTAKKLTQIDANGTTLRISGINMGSVSNIQSSPEILLTMLTQAGIEIVTPGKTLGTHKATFATSEGAAALSRYFEFSKEKVWSTRTKSDLELFASGKLAMYIAPSWRALDIVGMNSNLRFESLTLPVLPGANPNVPQYITSYWVDIVSRNSKHTKESWEFLNWLSQPEQLRKINQAQRDVRLIGNPYPRMDMAEDQKGAPYIGAIIDMAPNMKSWPLYDYGVWEETFRKELLEYEDQGGIAQTNLEKVEDEINKRTLKAIK